MQALHPATMSAQQPYVQQQNIGYASLYRHPAYIPDSSNIASTSTTPAPAYINAPSGPSSSLPQSSFRAPAHKHAHHLHSIPPREKSTRTLIIDHMLWVHGRTRFAQARAELGMTDRTGGPSSPNYVYRKRPESYEEEDEQGSEGEDTSALRARVKDPHQPDADDEDDRIRHQDLALARSLRVRAEGLEKVVTSMLDRPPPVHPINEEVLTPPTSPKGNATHLSHPHRLPNGVRLRLALGTIINDLFARQAPPPPYRHTHAPNAKIATPSDQSFPLPSVIDLPDSVSTLAPVSGAFATDPTIHQSIHSGGSVALQAQQYAAYSYATNQYTQSGSNYIHMQYPVQQQLTYTPPSSPKGSRPRPSERTRKLYAVGADPDTANSPPRFRCPRHLHTGCEICVEAKSPQRQTGTSNSRARTGSFGGPDKGSTSTNTYKAMPGGMGPGGGGITGWQEGSGIGSGLLRPGVRGSALRRKVRDGDSPEADANVAAGAGNTKLSKLIPRFIRLSALVAAELGREARGEEDAGASDDGREGEHDKDASGGQGTSGQSTSSYGPSMRATPRREWQGGNGSSPMAVPSSPTTSRGGMSSSQSARRRMYEYALRPTAEWYLLLSGLLTRAVLEGYLSAGWTGLQAVQCLMLVGFGINENARVDRELGESVFGAGEDIDVDEFSALDPDELPSLVEAVKILFPHLRDSFTGPKTRAEEEYETEMLERLKRFYDIPASTPDCATHMEDVAWQYPAEPVERAAVRFCEAIQRWRGKPELETYKKKPEPRMDGEDLGAPPPMTIDALVHSNPTSPTMPHAGHRVKKRLKRPDIGVYFTQSGVAPGSGAGVNLGLGSGMGASALPPPSIAVVSSYPSGSGRREEGQGLWAQLGGGAGSKRYRDLNDDSGRVEGPKRMYSS